MTSLLDVDVTDVLVTEMTARAQLAAIEMLAAARFVLTGPRSGRTYYKPGGGTYQASAPGEPPAERTGAFRGSFTPLPPVLRWDGDTLSVTVGIRSEGIPYAGRFDPAFPPYIGGMAPRPFVDAVIEAARPRIASIFGEPFQLGGG
jgi:hypothetical protein